MGRKRTYVVTGTASGIGRAAKDHLESMGARVIGIDILDAEVIADLSSPSGRDKMIEGVRKAADGVLDAVIVGAGVASNEARTVRINYFGALATLEGLRPMLVLDDHPRAVAVSSSSMIHPCDERIVKLCLDGNEEEAAAAGDVAPSPMTYSSSKLALSRWIRRAAPTAEWAGVGIPLNAIAPGTIVTPITQRFLNNPEGRAMLDQQVPMPLGGPGQPEQVAFLLAWLTSPENSMVTGQVIFIDGGADVVLRGDDIW